MEIALKFWSKQSGSTSNKYIPARSIERIYLNATDGSTLGFIERRTVAGNRGSESYYNAHRSAKGDTAVTTSDDVTMTISEPQFNALCAAAGTDPAYPVHAFIALKEYCSGIRWLLNKKGCDAMAKKAARRFEVAA